MLLLQTRCWQQGEAARAEVTLLMGGCSQQQRLLFVGLEQCEGVWELSQRELTCPELNWEILDFVTPGK